MYLHRLVAPSVRAGVLAAGALAVLGTPAVMAQNIVRFQPCSIQSRNWATGIDSHGRFIVGNARASWIYEMTGDECMPDVSHLFESICEGGGGPSPEPHQGITIPPCSYWDQCCEEVLVGDGPIGQLCLECDNCCYWYINRGYLWDLRAPSVAVVLSPDFTETATFYSSYATDVGRRSKQSSTGVFPITVGYTVAANVSIPLVQHEASWWDENGDINLLGYLQGGCDVGDCHSAAMGVSDDGSVIVGWSDDSELLCAYEEEADPDDCQSECGCGRRAFRAVLDTFSGEYVMHDISSDIWSQAHGVSPDGNYVVGIADGGAFIWSAAAGLQILPYPDEPDHGYALAVDVSNARQDGSVIVVGSIHNTQNQEYAVIWEVSWNGTNLVADAITLDVDLCEGYTGPDTVNCVWDIGDRIWPHTDSYATGVSADGSLVVGTILNNVGGSPSWRARSFVWSNGTATWLQDEYTFPYYMPEDYASAISSNGKVITGFTRDPGVNWAGETTWFAEYPPDP